MTLSQLQLFIIFSINGIIIGIIFDTFRIIRKSFKHKYIVICIQDALFWILSGFLLIYSTFVFNDGEFRAFMIFATIIGYILYLFTLSKLFIRIGVKIIKLLKKLIIITFKMALTPIKKLLLKPCTFLVINVKKSFKSLKRKCQKSKIFFENKKEKKDFDKKSSK